MGLNRVESILAYGRWSPVCKHRFINDLCTQHPIKISIAYRATDSAASRRSNIVRNRLPEHSRTSQWITISCRIGPIRIQHYRKTSRHFERHTANQREYARVVTRRRPGCSFGEVEKSVPFVTKHSNPKLQ